MSQNTHIVKANQTAYSMRNAKGKTAKLLLIKKWVREIRQAIKYSQGASA
jgi:hypothetical protein